MNKTNSKSRVKLKLKLNNVAVNGTPSQSYGVWLAICSDVARICCEEGHKTNRK